MRVPGKFLEHRVDLEAVRLMPRSDGAKFMPKRRVSALVVEKQKRVTDAREGSSTKGEEIQAEVHVLLQPEDRIPLGSKMTIWPGTSNERTLVSVSEAFGQHTIAPSSYQAWLI